MAPMRKLVFYLISLTTLFASLWGLHVLQATKSQGPAPLRGSGLSVGFSLAPGSGTIAVKFRDGRVWTDFEEGNEVYREAMRRLSYPSSQHNAPPYQGFGDSFGDLQRKYWRRIRKRIGLPASADVGALASVLIQLRNNAEKALSIELSAAAISAPHIVALYQDDLLDVVESAGMDYLHYATHGNPFLRDTAAAYAGYGQGLCEHYEDREKCDKEAEQMPVRNILSVHYATNALTLALAEVKYGPNVYEDDIRHYENFTLGSDVERHEDGSSVDESYWDQLGRTLESWLTSRPVYHPPDLPVDMVMFSGESAPRRKEDRFARTVLYYLEEVQPLPHDILIGDPLFASAKGTADMVMRYSTWPIRPTRVSDDLAIDL